MTFSVRERLPTIAVGQKAPASKTPTAADVGGDLDQDLDRPDARPGLLPDLGRRRARRAQAVHARLRDAEVLHERAMRTDARPVQAGRRGEPGRHLHQRRAVQAQARRRRAPARPRRRTTSSRRPTSPTSGACCRSRGSSRSIENGIVQGSYEVTITDAELDAILPVIKPAADPPDGLGRVLEPDRDLAAVLGPVPDPDGLRGRLVLDEMARRELGAVLEVADLEARGPVARPEGEAADLGRGPSRPRRRSPRPAAAPPPALPDRGLPVPPSSNAAPAGHDDDDAEDEREQVAGPPIHAVSVSDAAVPAPLVPVPVLPGAWSGVPSAQRGQVAGPGS